MVSLLYAQQENISSEWQKAAPYLWDAFFNEDVARSIDGIEAKRGTLTTGNKEDAGNVMRSMIAYSAISEGERPFGDTGIRAMFDDAGDLGNAIQAEGATAHISALAPYIAKSLVEYAGALALHDIEANPPVEQITRDPAYVTQAQASVSGILTPSADGNAISLNYTADTWKFANGGIMPDIMGKPELLEKIFPTIPVSSSPKAIGTLPDPLFAGTPTFSTVKQAMQTVWNVDSASVFDRVILSVNDSGAAVNLRESATFGSAALFVGGSGNDNVTGASGNGVAGFGNDLLIGNGGDDRLSGMGGDDILFGGSGSDTLSGGSGNNLLIGGADSDTFVITGSGSTIIDDTDGTLNIRNIEVGGQSASAETGSLESGIAINNSSAESWTLGNFLLTKTGIGGADLTLSSSNQTIVLKEFSSGEYGITLGDSLFFSTDTDLLSKPNTLNVYRKAVRTESGITYEFIESFASAATPSLGDFWDHIYADTGAGEQRIVTDLRDAEGTEGNDYFNAALYAAQQAFTVSTGAGRDAIVSHNNLNVDTTVYAGEDADRIRTLGGAGDAYGENGNDYFIVDANKGLASRTHLYGGGGRDQFNSSGGFGADLIDGGAGVDTLVLNLTSGDTGRANVLFDLPDGILALDGVNHQYRSIEQVTISTGGGDDSIISGNLSDKIAAGGGDNYIASGSGDDLIDIGANSANLIYAGDGNDIVRSGSDLGSGNASVNVVHAEGGDDELYSQAGDDFLYGGVGNDKLYGEAGADQLFGGSGSDIIVGGSSGAVAVGGFANGIQAVVGARPDYKNYIQNDDDLLAGGDGDDSYFVDSANDTVLEDADQGYDTVYSIVSVGPIDNVERITLVGTDEINVEGDGLSNSILGNAASNVIRGGAGDDTIFGEGGSDTLYGGEGDDRIGSGNTTGSGNRLLYGEDGNDFLTGGLGNDTLYGGYGNDIIHTAFGTDEIIGGGGDDKYAEFAPFNDDGRILPSTSITYRLDGNFGNDELYSVAPRQLVNAGHSHTIVMNGHTLGGQAQYMAPDKWQLSAGGQTYVLEGFIFKSTPYNTQIKIYRVGDTENSFTVHTFRVSFDQDQADFGVWFAEKPVLNRDPYQAAESIPLPDAEINQSFTVAKTDLLQGFADPDGDTLSVADLMVYGGSVIGEDEDAFTIQPNTGFSGSLELYWSVIDGRGGSADASTTVEVTQLSPPNQAPYIFAEPVSLAQGNRNEPFTISEATLLTGIDDPDHDPLSVSDLTVDHATVQANVDGSYTVTPEAGYVGRVAISYKVTDGNGGELSLARSAYVINPNHAPVLSGAPATFPSFAVNEYIVIAKSDLLEGYTDPEGDTLRVEQLSATNAYTYGDGADGYVIWPDYSTGGRITLTYLVTDGNGNHTPASNVLAITAAITPQPDSRGVVNLPGNLVFVDYGDQARGLTIHAGDADIEIFGTLFNDRIFGGAGEDFLFGGDGNDALHGRGGADFMIGGAGDDKYLIEDTNDWIIEETDGGRDIATVRVNYAIDENVEVVVIQNDAGLAVTGNAEANRVYGGAGNDTIYGEDGNDYISSNAGDDLLFGGSGNDELNGFAGNDTIYGDDGDDTLRGYEGDDHIYGGAGADHLAGNEGDDVLEGGAGDDIYLVVDATDLVVEAEDEGRDLVVAKVDYTLTDNVENLLFKGDTGFTGTGNALANKMTGSEGSDRLSGVDGDDTLLGAAGRDWLEGGKGNDILRGGPDADIFFFDNVSDTGRDRITDFSSGDILVTTTRIYDSNDDGIVTFGSNRMLDLFNGSLVDIVKDTGGKLTALEFDGMVTRDDVSYFVYSAVGSTAGTADLIL